MKTISASNKCNSNSSQSPTKFSPSSSLQKLFLRPGTIEEEVTETDKIEKCDGDDGVYSEVLLRPKQYYSGGMTKVPSASRVSTCYSSSTYVATRQESYR